MAAPSEETDDLVDELPTIVDHIEFEDAPENITPDEDVVGQPEVSARMKRKRPRLLKKL